MSFENMLDSSSSGPQLGFDCARAIRRGGAACAAIGVLLALLASSSRADVILTIQRHSDLSALIKVTGSLTGVATPTSSLDYLSVIAVSAPAAMNLGTVSGDLTVGGHGVELAGVPGIANLFTIDFDNDLALGDGGAGSLLVTLNPGAAWAPVGTTGAVIWGVGIRPPVVGSFSIVSVSEPAVTALLGIGLVGVLIGRRSRA